jgi:23S rRNA pseudouridine1911/1915/1917 synthase
MKTKQYYIDNLKVLYEDNHLIVLEKPINVLSQKDDTDDFDINEIVKEYLKNKYQKPGNVYLGLVHRLDRRVGGVLVLAKTSKAASRLSEAIRNNAVRKYYIAKVQGKLKCDDSIELNIKKDEKNKIAIVSNDGKPASLDYKVLGYDKENTFVLINLHTGRYNQIRVSFSHIGYPIVNDYKYSNCSKNNDELGLWCYKMIITHPISKEEMVFEDMPQNGIWKQLYIRN